MTSFYTGSFINTLSECASYHNKDQAKVGVEYHVGSNRPGECGLENRQVPECIVSGGKKKSTLSAA